jgi:hypothetical protein
VNDKRNDGGVRLRADGKGDGWAEHHRNQQCQWHMQDVDGLFAASFFGKRTDDRLFAEYAADNYENRGKIIRRFAMVALFDRKETEPAAFSNENHLSLAVYLHMCRVFRDAQSQGPRFFYVVGGNAPPWEMIEMDIDDGTIMRPSTTLDNGSWEPMWKALGLLELRQALTKWLEKR